jgi:hypothetical protein
LSLLATTRPFDLAYLADPATAVFRLSVALVFGCAVRLWSRDFAVFAAE